MQAGRPFLILLLALSVHTQDYTVFVSPSASPGSSSCSQESPCSSMNEVFQHQIPPGTFSMNIFLFEGTYQGQNNIGIHYPDIPIEISSLNNAAVIFECVDAAATGFYLYNTTTLNNIEIHSCNNGINITENAILTLNQVNLHKNQVGIVGAIDTLRMIQCQGEADEEYQQAFILLTATTVEIERSNFTAENYAYFSFVGTEDTFATIEITDTLFSGISSLQLVNFDGTVRNSQFEHFIEEFQMRIEIVQGNSWLFDNITFIGTEASCYALMVPSLRIANSFLDNSPAVTPVIESAYTDEILLENNRIVGTMEISYIDYEGALFVSSTNCSFTLSSALSLQASADFGGSVIFSNSEITMNSTVSGSYGVETKYMNVDIDNCKFMGCGISVDNFDVVAISSSEIAEAVFRDVFGGAVYLSGETESFPSIVSLSNVTFKDNQANTGSVISCDDSIFVDLNFDSSDVISVGNINADSPDEFISCPGAPFIPQIQNVDETRTVIQPPVSTTSAGVNMTVLASVFIILLSLIIVGFIAIVAAACIIGSRKSGTSDEYSVEFDDMSSS